MATSPTANVIPRGAGLRITSTEPDLPITSKGSEWGVPQPHSHEPQPRLISIMFSLALSMALRIEVPTSLPLQRPMPMNPSPLPTTQVILNLTLLPESVILCTMLTSMTSSLRSGNSMSTISASRSGSFVASAWLMLVTSPERTMCPSLVFGTHSILSSLQPVLDFLY